MRWKKYFLWILLSIFGVLFSGCKSGSIASSTSTLQGSFSTPTSEFRTNTPAPFPVETSELTKSLESNPWHLIRYAESEGELVDLILDSKITADFGDGELQGNSGCNTYSTRYQAGGDNILFEKDLFVLTDYCSDNLMKQELRYLAILPTSAFFQIENDQLIIYNIKRTPMLVFAISTFNLVGPTWLLNKYQNRKGEMVSPPKGLYLKAEFGNDGKLITDAGCNLYQASFSIDGENFKITSHYTNPSGIKMRCLTSPESHAPEHEYLSDLYNAVTIRIQGEILEVFGENGALLLKYHAQNW